MVKRDVSSTPTPTTDSSTPTDINIYNHYVEILKGRKIPISYFSIYAS